MSYALTRGGRAYTEQWMTIWERHCLENWTEIQDLVRMKVEESQVLDFKSEAYAHPKRSPEKKKDDRLELRRDVVSFANASGGTIILGISEDGQGRAKNIVGLDDWASSERFITEVVSHDIHPALDQGVLRIRALQSPPEENLAVILIEIMSSRPGRPRAVSNEGVAEFWIRVEKSKRPMTYNQIEEGFHGDAEAQEQRRIDAQARREVMRIRYQLEQMAMDWASMMPLLDRLGEYVESIPFGPTVGEEVLQAVYDVLAFARADIPYEIAERSCYLIRLALPVHSWESRAPTSLSQRQVRLLGHAASQAVDLIYEATRRMNDIILINTGAKLLHAILRYTHLNEISDLETEILSFFDERIRWAREDKISDGPELLQFYRDDALKGRQYEPTKYPQTLGWLVWKAPKAFPEHYRRDGP